MMRAEADGATMLELPESTLPLFDFDQATYCTGPAARPSAPNRLFPRDLNLGVNQTHDDATREAVGEQAAGQRRICLQYVICVPRRGRVIEIEEGGAQS